MYSSLNPRRASTTPAVSVLSNSAAGLPVTVPLPEACNTAASDAAFFLLSMPLSSLTTENVENLEDAAARAESEAATMRALTPTEIWIHELSELEAAIVRIPGMKLLRNKR